MTRRSFLLLALIFVLMLSVSSVALAASSDTVQNGDVSVTLYGNNIASTFSDKVNSFYDNNINAFAFIIEAPISDSDWRPDDGVIGQPFFHLEINITKPDNDNITQYTISGMGNPWTDSIYYNDKARIGNAIAQEMVKEWHNHTRSYDFSIQWQDSTGAAVGEPVPYKFNVILDYRPTTKVTAVDGGTYLFAHSSLWGGSTFSSDSKVSYECNYDNIIYMINKSLSDSDWQKDGDTNYLWLDTALSVPPGARYFKNNGANNPEIKEIPTTPDGYVDGRVWDGYRIDEPDFNNGDIRHTYSYTWYNAEQTELSTSQYKIEVRYTAFPTPVRASYITPDTDAPSNVSNGAVRYTVSGVNTLAFDTVVKKPRNRVAAYSLNDDSTIHQFTEGSDSITISTAGSDEFTISWYDSNNDLVCTEYIDIIIENFTPASGFTWIDHNFFAPSTVNGILGNKPVVSNSTNAQGIPVTYITYNLDLSNMDLQQLLYHYSDGEVLSAPYRVNLPETAVKKCSFGSAADLPADSLLHMLGIMDYSPCNGNTGIQHLIEMGYSTADGSSVIITPNGGERAQLIKWTDSNGQEYYHMIVLVFNFASSDSFRVEAISPSAERVQFNVNGHPSIKNNPSYINGVVTYTVGSRNDSDPSSVCTAVDKPFEDVTSVTVYPQWGDPYGRDFTQSDLPCIIDSYALQPGVSNEYYQLEWTRRNGSKYFEAMTIYVIPDGNTWMEEHWVPAEAGRTQPVPEHADMLKDHVSYDSNTGRWLFDIDAESKPDLDNEAFGYPMFMITPPEGATHYTVALWGSPIYSDHLADSTENEMQSYINGGMLNPIEDDSDSLIWYDKDLKKLCYTPCGKLLFKTDLAGTDGMSIYTVSSTMPGHAQIAIFEWFKPDGNGGFERITFGNNKRGEFVYCEKEPYLNVKETTVLGDTSAIAAPVTVPTAVVLESSNPKLIGSILRVEIPLQENASKNHWYYEYYKLTFVDNLGNIVEVPSDSKIKVYMPYPEGTDMNSNIQHFDVWHYHDENHGSHDKMSKDGNLKLEEYGITFETSSFSPFLLSYKAEETSDNGNGGSGSGNSGGSSSSGSGSKLPSVVTPSSARNVEVPLGSTASMSISASRASNYQWYIDRNDGKGFVAIPGANDSSYTTSPVEAKNSGYRYFCRISNNKGSDDSPIFTLSIIGMEIPKTGDASLLIPVLMLVGAMAISRRRTK